MDRLAARRHQRHARLAARHQHGLAADRAIELGGGGGDLRLVRSRARRVASASSCRFGVIRVAPLVDRKILALGIDDHRLAELAAPPRSGCADDTRRERALGIVGQHHARRARQRRERRDRAASSRVSGIERLRQLPVGAQQMGRMVLGDEADLARGRPRRIDDQMGFDQRLSARARASSARPASSSPTTPTKDAARAERGNVARHVAGAADDQLAAGHRKDRRRRLRRDARDLAVDELVEHQVADADHGLLGNELERVLEIEHDVIAGWLAGYRNIYDFGQGDFGQGSDKRGADFLPYLSLAVT